MNFFWLLKAKRWAQNPPSWQRIALVFAIVTACLVLVGLERYGLLPDWMTAEPRRNRVIR